MRGNKYGEFKYEMDGFASHFPSQFEDMVSWVPRSRSVIVATLSDGSVCEYNHLLNTIRFVRGYNGSEESWRLEFYVRLMELMEERGCDQSKLSEMTGISQKTISNYIHRQTTPSGYNIRRLERALECPKGYLTDF